MTIRTIRWDGTSSVKKLSRSILTYRTMEAIRDTGRRTGCKCGMLHNL